jgi:DNA-binding transcriptional regulator YhcF (GntR family)
MIRLWLSRETSIPLREQLTTQLLLGIFSRRLSPGERLPSVRALARRLRIHPNTVSAAYRDLAGRGWVRQVRGSGVFVCQPPVSRTDGNLDTFVRVWVRDGMARGFALADMEEKIRQIARELRSRTLLVIDPDPELARILAAEIGEGIGTVVPFAGLAEAPSRMTEETCILVNQAHAETARALLGTVSCRVIELQSMQDFVAGHARPLPEALIAVISRSGAVLNWAARLLATLGFEPSRLVLRNPIDPHWQDGLSICDIVASDAVTARELTIQPVVFRLVKDQFIESMRRFVTGEEL